MRPKKVILLVAASEAELSQHGFVMATWGYAVLRAEGAAGAIAKLEASRGPIDLVVLLGPVEESTAVMRRARETHPQSRSMVISTAAEAESERDFPDMFLRLAEWNQAEVRERIRTMTARKRGPKGQPKTLPPMAAKVQEYWRARKQA